MARSKVANPQNLVKNYSCAVSVNLESGVIEEVKEGDYVDKSIKCKDLREVYSEKEIPSRCRTVARECRGNEASTSETFSPTSAGAAAKGGFYFMIFTDGNSGFFDIKNAYVMVRQTEQCYRLEKESVGY